MIEVIPKKDGVAADVARKTAFGYLVPGVILQPSGVFAALRAQDAGCRYFTSELDGGSRSSSLSRSVLPVTDANRNRR